MFEAHLFTLTPIGLSTNEATQFKVDIILIGTNLPGHEPHLPRADKISLNETTDHALFRTHSAFTAAALIDQCPLVLDPPEARFLIVKFVEKVCGNHERMRVTRQPVKQQLDRNGQKVAPEIPL